MSERPKTLEYYSDIYADLTKRFDRPENPIAPFDDAPDSHGAVTFSVVQILSLTPASFEAKFSEICDCLDERRVAGPREVELFKRLGQSYAHRHEQLARETLDAILSVGEPSDFLRAVQDEATTVQAQSDKKKKFWKLIGGLIGAVVGGALGGWKGAALGFVIGSEVASYIHDTYGGGRTGGNVVAGPNGEPCTPPFFT